MRAYPWFSLFSSLLQTHRFGDSQLRSDLGRRGYRLVMQVKLVDLCCTRLLPSCRQRLLVFVGSVKIPHFQIHGNIHLNTLDDGMDSSDLSDL